MRAERQPTPNSEAKIKTAAYCGCDGKKWKVLHRVTTWSHFQFNRFTQAVLGARLRKDHLEATVIV